jgi:hypothetical protein
VACMGREAGAAEADAGGYLLGSIADDCLCQITTKKIGMSKTDMTRRLRLGDLRKVLRFRYGPTLPDDDAGRDDLELLLDVVSFAPDARRRMKNIIETWASWMSTKESYELVDHVLRKPDYLRKIKKDQLGEKLNLTYQERQALGIRTIAPADLTPEEFEERRKERRREKDRERKRHRRCKAGVKSRTVYLATSLAQLKPWEREGISRRTWERRRTRGAPRVASVSANKLFVIHADRPASPNRVIGWPASEKERRRRVRRDARRQCGGRGQKVRRA